MRYGKQLTAALTVAALITIGGMPSVSSAPQGLSTGDTQSATLLSKRPYASAVPDRPKYPKAPALVRNYGHDEMQGYRESVYKGKFYRASQESWRKCVMWRESRFRYGARNKPSVSSAAGAYQFLDIPWRQRSGSLPWMMHAENKKVYGPVQAKRILRVLQSTPIERWGRPWQDQAFFTALNYQGAWSGKKHWNATVPGTGC